MRIDRKLTYIQLIGIILALMASYYMEYFLLIEPCLLCIIQRVLLVVLLLTTLANLIFKPLQTFFDVSTVILFFMGLGLSVHHLSLTMSLDPNALCLPKFSYLISTFGIWETLSMALSNPASCSKVQSYFLGLNLPIWLILFYSIQLILSFLKVYITYSRSKPN